MKNNKSFEIGVIDNGRSGDEIWIQIISASITKKAIADRLRMIGILRYVPKASINEAIELAAAKDLPIDIKLGNLPKSRHLKTRSITRSQKSKHIYCNGRLETQPDKVKAIKNRYIKTVGDLDFLNTDVSNAIIISGGKVIVKSLTDSTVICNGDFVVLKGVERCKVYTKRNFVYFLGDIVSSDIFCEDHFKRVIDFGPVPAFLKRFTVNYQKQSKDIKILDSVLVASNISPNSMKDIIDGKSIAVCCSIQELREELRKKKLGFKKCLASEILKSTGLFHH